MNILDLPQFKDFKNNKQVKVLCHKHEIWEHYKGDVFEKYQNEQGKDVFKDVDYIISFIAERHKFARYVGVWKVLSKKKLQNGRYRYRTEGLSNDDDLLERLIVEWGDGNRAWAQWLHPKGNKKVYEILPPNYVKEFPGFYDFILTYRELKELIQNPVPNREWQRMLSAISGVYVILDTKSGDQYVGSACGENGLWGRWKQYSNDPSGGNKLLKELLRKYPRRSDEFQFSVLRVLEPHSTQDTVIEQETLLKEKLGSKVLA